MRTQDERLLRQLAVYLNFHADAVTEADVRALSDEFSLTDAQAFALLLAGALGLDAAGNEEDARTVREDFPRMLCPLDASVYAADPYICAVCASPHARDAGESVPNARILRNAAGSGRNRGAKREGTIPAPCAFELGCASYRPYELFVANDLRAYPDGAVLPVLGYFTQPFAYPVLTENGREWMTATPNEINTIRPVAEAAYGHVLTLGLGLGYFAFHALLNPRVESVTAVERSGDAIRLFRERILPAFPRPECLTLLEADAFEMAPSLYRSGKYDFVFADLWHDAGDGLPMYERLKRMEAPGPEYRYWIEKTLEFYR